MINLYNQVPAIYPSASRDFQYLSWLFNIVLNAVKHNVDALYYLPNNKADPRLTELLALTLGFKVKRNYDQKQLEALVSIIPSILKYKGTKKAITMAGEALITASGTSGMFKCELKDGCLEVLLPKELVDTTLFMDLLPYILPAGITCRVVRKTQTETLIDPIKVKYNDTLQAAWHEDLWDDSTQSTTGLADLYNVGNTKPIFTNYEGSTGLNLNAGLLDNSIIPTLESLVADPSGVPDFSTEPNEYGTTVIINKYSTEENDHGTTTIIGGQ